MNSTSIEWAFKSWNPITGCPGPKISSGCENCYAERIAKTRLAGRYGYDAEDPFGIRVHYDRFDEPLRLKKPSHIFVCSMGDLFHDAVDLEDLERLFWVFPKCPQHTFILLTKRIEKALWWFNDGLRLGDLLPNVWLNVTICNQDEADEKIPLLLQTPAAKRGVSIEPMLGPINLRKAYPQDYMYCSFCKWHGYDAFLASKLIDGEEEEDSCPVCGNVDTYALDYPYEDEELALGGLDWVICGGETGSKARPMHPDWVRSLRDQCKEAGVPFFFKGWGEYFPGGQTMPGYGKNIGSSAVSSPSRHKLQFVQSGADKYIDAFESGVLIEDVPYMHDHTSRWVYKVGKKRAGRLLDGEEWNEMPA